MKRMAKSLLASSMVLACSPLLAADQPHGGPLGPDGPIARSYVESARALSMGDDNPIIKWNFHVWCETGYRTTREAGTGQVIDRPVDRDHDMLSPTGFIDPADDRPMPDGGVRFMDNAWYFGTDLTGMVVVKTNDGLMLFDALTNRADMMNLGIEQMKKAGLDPSTIKYIFIGHEHGDHYGGINVILENYAPDAKVVASEVAAQAITKLREGTENGTIKPRFFGPPPAGSSPEQIKAAALDSIPKRIDIRIQTAPDMPVGATAMDLGKGFRVIAAPMPGHTAGQMQLIVPSAYNGAAEKLLLWSGNDNFEKSDAYGASADFLRALSQWQGASAFLNTHAYQSAAFGHLRTLKKNPKAPNPFVMGTQGIQRLLGVYSDCQHAQFERMKEGSWKAL